MMEIYNQHIEVKVPVIVQMDSLECGAACLAMILAYYGKWLPLSEVRLACGVSRDGTSGKNLLTAARNYGLIGKGRRVKSIDPLEVPIPCILHYNHNHFVVFCGYKHGKAIINDPAQGRILVPIDDFNQSFHGLLMECVPGENFVKEGKKPSHLSFILELISNYKRELLFLLIAATASTIIGIIMPALNQIFLDQIITGKGTYAEQLMAGLLLLMLLLEITVSIIDTLSRYRINRRIAMESSFHFLKHMLSLSIDFFSQHMIGDLVRRQKSNETISQSIIQQAAPILQQFATIILYVLIMIIYEPMLATIGIVLSIFSLLLSLYVSAKQIDIAKVQVQHLAQVRSYSMCGLNSMESIKASGAEQGFYSSWADKQTQYNNTSVKMATINAWITTLPQFMQMLSTAFITVLGAGLIIEGDFTIGILVAFQAFLSAFYAPVNSLTQTAKQLQQMKVQISRIEDVFESPIDAMEIIEDTYKPDSLAGNIQVTNLTFGYGRLQPPTIHDIFFEVKEGESLGIVGGSGSGKSTLIGVLLGLYPRWEGLVTYDGVDINHIPRSYFANYAGIVRQQTSLIAGTVRDNLKMWNDSISDETMIAAAKDALIHDEIMSREGGYDSPVLEGGANFSGGQRQKIELARSLVYNPKILILDEATSALDSVTEERILDNLKKRKITSLIVAHRLSAIRDCDEIIVLKNGHITQRGTHKQLLSQTGTYRQLVESEKGE